MNSHGYYLELLILIDWFEALSYSETNLYLKC